MEKVETVNATELADILRRDKEILLVDVREEEEWRIGHLPDARLIPLSSFAQRAPEELSKDAKVILYCHRGGRSERAGMWLKQNGYENVRHLAGGIDVWSIEIDSSIPRY